MNSANYKDCSARIIYASTAGAHMDSDVMSGGGTDDTAVLQNILDLAPRLGSIHLVMDGAALVNGLNVHSNTTIECLNHNCGFFLADGANRPILRNAHPGDGERADRNITLAGGVYNGNCLKQVHTMPDRNFVVGLAFYGIEDLTVRDVVIRDHRTFALHLANWQWVNLENIRFDLRNIMVGQNQDGIHLNGPGRFLSARNICGNTEDDMFAIVAEDAWAKPLSETRALGPYIREGDITDVTLDGLVMEDSIQGVRILSRTSRVDRIYIRNVTGTNRDFGFIIDTFHEGGGNFGTIVIDNVDVHQHDPVRRAEGWFFATVGGRIENLILRNVVFHDTADDRPMLYVDESADISLLTLDGLSVYEKKTRSVESDLIKVLGSVEHMSVHNARIFRETNLAPSGSFIHVKGVRPEIGVHRLCLNNVVAYRLDHLVRHTKGRLSVIRAFNVHDEGGAGATFSLRGGDVEELLLSGYSGVKAVETAETGRVIIRGGDAFTRLETGK